MRKTIFFTAICMHVCVAFTQTETINVPSEPDSVDVKYDRIYKLFLEENNQEVTHLYKLCITPFGNPGFAFEQKFCKVFSTETSIFFGKRNGVLFMDVSGPIRNTNYGIGSFPYSVGFSEQIKYYYNLKRRQRLGRKINGFSGNYFSIGYSGQYLKYSDYVLEIYNVNKYYQETTVSYGLQRRIGNIGFIEPSVDINFFQDMDKSSILFRTALRLKLGFSINSFANLKRMLS